MNIELLKHILAGLTRHLLGGVVAWLIAKGILQPGQAEDLIMLIVAGLIVIGGTIWNKVRTKKVIETALDLPAGANEEDLKRALKRS